MSTKRLKCWNQNKYMCGFKSCSTPWMAFLRYETQSQLNRLTWMTNMFLNIATGKQKWKRLIASTVSEQMTLHYAFRTIQSRAANIFETWIICVLHTYPCKFLPFDWCDSRIRIMTHNQETPTTIKNSTNKQKFCRNFTLTPPPPTPTFLISIDVHLKQIHLSQLKRGPW